MTWGGENEVLSSGEEGEDDGDEACESSTGEGDAGGNASDHQEAEEDEEEERDAEEEGLSETASDDESEYDEDSLNLHQSRHRSKKSLSSSELLENFPRAFGSWKDFHDVFQAYQVKTYQHFSKRTSTSVAVRNNQIERAATRLKHQSKRQRKEVQLLPDEWGQYSKTLFCTHGQPYQARGKGKRQHEKVRGTECTARVNARVTATLDDSWVVRVTVSGSHNHDLNEHVWEEYSGNGTVKNAGLRQDVEVLRKTGANAKGKKTKLKDVHTMIQRQRVKTQAGLNDTQRALAVLDEFCHQNGGNSAEIVVDSDTDVARIVSFQTAKMKRLFKALHEVVLVDSTYDTNANRYKLFSFVVHDVSGKVS
ncbi:unnamed protein product [Phytophthora fragariaefolia]|uniref:Unnamed protein product n=1 Tax=Phytophthora fragariaefolia TaxID=1490495 RepID=A0A9W6Y984_9STRA|nr:unnamed protein product [Phytophthora fragariaefolia]